MNLNYYGTRKAEGYIARRFQVERWSNDAVSKGLYAILKAKALQSGLVDCKYRTHNYGMVAAYEGNAIVEHEGVQYFCHGVGSTGTASHLSSEGYVAVYPLTEEDVRELRAIEAEYPQSARFSTSADKRLEKQGA